MATKAELFRDHAERTGSRRPEGPPKPPRSSPADSAGPGVSASQVGAAEIVRLTNRTAALTLGAALACIVALVTVARTFSGGGTVSARLAAAGVAAAAVIAVVAVWRSRVALRRATARATRGQGERGGGRRP